MELSAETLQLLTVGTGLVILAGVYGLISPSFPGVLVIWASVFAYALLTNFEVITNTTLLLVTVLCGIVVLIDLIASLRGTRHMNMNYLIVLGAIAVGLLFMTIRSNNLLWFLFGAILGGSSVALLTGHDEIYKFQTKQFILIGFAGSTILKLLIGLTILGIFLQTTLGIAI